MIAGLSGSLLSHDALSRLLRSADPTDLPREGTTEARRALRTWFLSLRDRMGPSWGPRHVYDLVAEPLTRALGFTSIPLGATGTTLDAILHAGAHPAAVVIVTGWNEPADVVWRHAVHLGLAHEARWSLCMNGPALRVFDVHRAYTRRHIEFDIGVTLDHEETFRILWGLLHASAFRPGSGGTSLDRIVALSDKHRVDVRLSLREGVLEALLKLIAAFRLVSKSRSSPRLLDESLIVVYRILFLLFAEARGLVPLWHPIYRDAYTVERLRPDAEGGSPRTGVWETLQAIARLAHQGCRAGTLRVPPFNGRLFSPADAPLADTVPLDDDAVAAALVDLTTRASRNGREQISYADLGVEQLGGVYEHLLDFDLASGAPHSPVVLLRTGRRKATGSFYTPRSLTDFLVRRTLAPLVERAAPERILSLRVLDPAMGSGAFLVAACRYLSLAYEQALITAGTLSSSDIDEGDRAGFRRVIAQRCLYGVDVNPMAVQLGRLSLWLATLAADRPLTFLDHHLRAGNSLVGGSIEGVLRERAPGVARRAPRDLPLFAAEALQSSLGTAVVVCLGMMNTPDDTIGQVRKKERALAALHGQGGPAERWKRAADLWCSAWYAGRGLALQPPAFRSLLDSILGRTGGLPAHLEAPFLARAAKCAESERFFHWPLEFPEVFYSSEGLPLPEGGFDAVLGNPPWEMMRADGEAAADAGLLRFVRGCGEYVLQGRGHGNLYQLFVERTLHMLKPAGRCGMILPSGFATDQSCAPLRRTLFGRTSIDTFVTLENRDGIFPIHRGLKFLLMTLSRAGSTTALPVRSGIRAARTLDTLPDAGPLQGAVSVPMTAIARLSGEDMAVPDIRTPADLDIISCVTTRVPPLADPAGWNVRFGRELNATEDRPHFTTGASGLPVLEGKGLRPFLVDLATARYRIPAARARRLLKEADTFSLPRLAYRDVAAPTNRTTLIAAIVPAGVVTTHTLFCLKDRLQEVDQHFLCGVFNSYVANYFVRLRVSTHVTTGIIARLPVPRPPSTDPSFREISLLSRSLQRRPEQEFLARLNVLVARLYGLSGSQFERVLETFPLIPAGERDATMRMFLETIPAPR
ncbi:hypothetical protein BH24ACI4_BH24ACI4_10730 [soil metagenome]